ncbi:hypothetical protein [Bdellovibrio sp. BCCA]|uniref:hypothetical protein n=1 Tax=Bdellovibrio sp. BCCA TaxID=3136281 RepID=UPI0030F10131
MNNLTAIKTMFLMMLAFLAVSCSGGGGGGGGSSAGSSSISYTNTTVTINENSIKDGREIQVIVSPKGTDGSAYSIEGKYDLNIQFLPSSGTTFNLTQADFQKVGNTYVARITPDASADALFYLVLNGAAYGNANLGDISNPKLSSEKWTECKDPSPDSANTTQIWRKRNGYNLICDYDDLARLYYNGQNDISGLTITVDKYLVSGSYVFDREGLSSQSSNRRTAFQNSFTEDFVLMIDVNNFLNPIYNNGTDSNRNRFFTEWRTGRVYLNGKNGNNSVIFGISVTPNSYEPNLFNPANIISGVPVGF